MAYTETTYDGLLIAAEILFATGHCRLADDIVTVLHGVDVIDGTWNALNDPFGNGSDAIVDAPDQYYPFTTSPQYWFFPADSHTGATRSNHVRDELYSALVQTFNVPTQSSCTFSVSPATYSISSSGGSGSFSLGTGTGCKWSAVSNTDWISITSGSSGAGGATISFSVNSNVGTPRNGTVKLGTQKSSATFAVVQSGFCSYSLSDSTVAIHSGGGSATVGVNTPYWCPWSAVSNASWLTITGGASGTGYGSFTVSASSNTGNTSLLGTVTVMSQTLNVVLGDPVGTPGTGSVTINGAARWTCSVYPCGNRVWESGTVTVTIGGDSFTTGYAGASVTASQLATNLAIQINSSSIVSATVSGSTITLIASENGANTNYSLSTSYTFDTVHFSSPAFTASLSGMAGGTD